VEIFAATAEVGFTRLVVRLGICVGNDRAEELKRAFNFGMIERLLVAEQFLAKADDRLANFPVRCFVTWNDRCFDSCKQNPLGSGAVEISANVQACDIVGHDPLNGSHHAAGIGIAFRHGDGIDTSIENFVFVIESPPRRAKDGIQLALQLFGREQSNDTDIVQFCLSLRVFGDSGDAVSAIEICRDDCLERGL